MHAVLSEKPVLMWYLERYYDTLFWLCSEYLLLNLNFLSKSVDGELAACYIYMRRQ